MIYGPNTMLEGGMRGEPAGERLSGKDQENFKKAGAEKECVDATSTSIESFGSESPVGIVKAV